MWRIEFFVKKWNMYEAHILTRQLQQTCTLETTPMCLNIRLRVNKKFYIHINFIKINVNVFLLCAPHVMTSIILHTRRPNCQYKVCDALGFYVSADFHFSHLRSWKARFSHHSISPNELCTNEIKVVGGQ